MNCHAIVWPSLAVALAVSACGPRGALVSPAGCVLRADDHGYQTWKKGGGTSTGAASDEYHREPLPDLDGDGQSDVKVVIDSAADPFGNETALVYLSNHGCARLAGEFGARRITPLSDTDNAVKQLRVYENLIANKGECNGVRARVTVHKFDGTSYKPGPPTTCPCSGDAPPECGGS